MQCAEKNKLLGLVGGIALALMAMPALAVSDQKMLTIGTAGVTGVYFPAGGAICRLFNIDNKEHGTKCVVESTEGSIANIDALKAGDIDVGIVQSDWQYHAYNGSGYFHDKGANRDLRSVFSLHSEPFTVVARVDAGIKKFEDLKGKRVNIGNPGSGMRATMEVLMRAYGWSYKDFAEVKELQAMDQGQALCENHVDAIVYAAGHPNGAIQEITGSCPTKLISVSGPVVDKLIESNPFYGYVTIPGGMYRSNRYGVKTFGVRASVVTTTAVPSDEIYHLVKSVFNHFDDFKTLHPVFSTLDKVSMVLDVNAAPLHDGAMRYFKETGLYDQALAVQEAPEESVAPRDRKRR
jgi:uncharacterized protein